MKMTHTKLLYECKGLPLNQNRVYDTAAAARAE
jgi:hypothetical protein